MVEFFHAAPAVALDEYCNHQLSRQSAMKPLRTPQPMPSRRAALLALATAQLAACAAPPQTTPAPQRLGLSAEDAALAHKFRGISKGGELYVDATFDTGGRQVVTQPNGVIFVPAMGSYAPTRSGKGYRGVEIEGVRILRSGQRRGITRTLKAMIKRRSAIEYMKMDGRLGRNPLKG